MSRQAHERAPTGSERSRLDFLLLTTLPDKYPSIVSVSPLRSRTMQCGERTRTLPSIPHSQRTNLFLSALYFTQCSHFARVIQLFYSLSREVWNGAHRPDQLIG